MGPVIASVSLGGERLFRLEGKNSGIAFAERLPHGSLLIMAGETQKNFKHEVPKEPDVAQPRLNLTSATSSTNSFCFEVDAGKFRNCTGPAWNVRLGTFV